MTGGKEESRKIVSICIIARFQQVVEQVGAKFKPQKHPIKNRRRMVDDSRDASWFVRPQVCKGEHLATGNICRSRANGLVIEFKVMFSMA